MPALIYKPGTPKERVFPLRVGLNGVGRNRDNRVCLKRADISRNHAEIAVTPERVILKDLGSSNHSFVNGRKVKITELSDGDEVRFSSVRLAFHATFEPQPHTGEDATGDTATACTATGEAAAGDDAERDGADALAAEIAAKGRVEEGVTPARRAELEDMAADMPVPEPEAGAAGTPSLLRIPDGAPNDRNLARLQILLDVANRLSAPTCVATRMAQALELTLSYLDVDRVAVLERPPAQGDGDAGRETADAGGAEVPAPGDTRRPPRVLAVRARDGDTPSLDEPVWQAALVATAFAKRGLGLVVDDAADGGGVRVDLCLPLGHAAADAALYLVSWAAAGAYSDDDMAFIEQLAEQIGIALANARAVDALHDDEDETDSEALPSGHAFSVVPSQLDSATGP
ncbi:MAG: FHA domain-containing protein [Thiohalocapsa sp.]|uniref:FHA domain-containing protein n=1 Tax=Thiohalocapsa sp. TaxID=2497641 RepID=UPI0025D8CA21|nr:FHA domain-containing protein [Thiohalocapsa sp.]MCG6940328.1 FHA domain-containing protein [Thiohalocapsa sp.]